MIRYRFLFQGRVQGVGFRPAIYRLAARLSLGGWVGNTPQGVVAEVEGPSEAVEAFRRALATGLPPLARVERLDEHALAPRGERGFRLRESEAGGRLTLVPPDLALCADCRRELFTPGDRRHRYPFINCTRCGPRYTVAERLPYDRDHTVMRRFPMCPACRAEYENADDRRFHHQTVTCPQCGPRLAWQDGDGRTLARDEAALAAAAEALRRGAVLAVKGLGGFHLMADATAAEPVARLRRFKNRPGKPFAVMFPSLDALERCCALRPEERALLLGFESPLLLAEWNGTGVAAEVAPGQRRLGVMLPYTPLHALLLHDLDRPLLATSGNRGGEPICHDEVEAVSVFAGLADGLLVHDRPIVRPVDDSIVQFAAGAPRLLRRARGWVPAAFPETAAGEPAAGEPAAGVPAAGAPSPDAAVDDGPSLAGPLLAAGGHLKTTLALRADAQIVVSAHIGDLDTPQARELHAGTARDLAALLCAEPALILHDAHPDYASVDWARRQGKPLAAVPHHYAHLAGCALEHGIAPPFAGCVWDGSGLGEDGTLWGGETLAFDGRRWSRRAGFAPFPLPGGEAAAREPRRALLGVLLALDGEAAWADPLVAERFAPAELKLLRAGVERGINCPVTSSAGRLFDAVASLLGLCQRQSFEGEAAMLLQTAAEAAVETAAVSPVAPDGASLDWRPALRDLIRHRGGEAPALALAFHRALAELIVQQARAAGARVWLMSGGCFQNRLLLELACDGLAAAGVRGLAPERYPAGDGGLSFGQIAYALAGRAAAGGE